MNPRTLGLADALVHERMIVRFEAACKAETAYTRKVKP